MFTRISSLSLAVLMFFVFLGSSANLYIFGASVLILIFAALAINFKRLNFTWPHLLLPTLYLIAAGSVYVIISNRDFRLVYLIAAAIIFYFLEAKLGRESHYLQNVFLLSSFALFLSVFAVQFYFNIKVWWIVPVFFALGFLLAIQGFAGFSLPTKKYFYVLIAMIVAETAWGLSFWPSHYFVDAVVLFCFFYILWLFSFSAFFGKLSRQKVYWQLMLVAIVLILTLSTAAWRTIK